MSAIDTYLNYIATKDYARDVRTAIVNAIRECYNNTQNPSLREEAFIAAIEAELDNGHLTGLDLGDGDVTTSKIANGAVTTPKIANGAITQEKLSPNIEFVQVDDTLSNEGEAADAAAVGVAINTLNGRIVKIVDLLWEQGSINIYGRNTGDGISTYIRTDYISIPTAFTVNANSGYQFIILRYTLDKELISKTDWLSTYTFNGNINELYRFLVHAKNNADIDKAYGNDYVVTSYMLNIESVFNSFVAISDMTSSKFGVLNGNILPSSIGWEQGSLSTNGGKSADGSSDRVRSNFFMPLKDFIIERKVGYEFSIYTYTLEEVLIERTTSWQTYKEITDIEGKKYKFIVKTTNGTDPVDKDDVDDYITITDRVNNVVKNIEYSSGIRQQNVLPNLKIVYHRGVSNVAPEQTVPAFMLAAERGYKYVEVDIQFTSDDVAILMHDSTINRTGRNSDGSAISGNISPSDITYEQLLQYDFGIWKDAKYAGTKVLRLDDFLELCKIYGFHPYLEIKNNDTQEHITEILRIVASRGMRYNVTFISLYYDALVKVKNAWPDATLGLNGSVSDMLELRNGYNKVFSMTQDNTSMSKINQLIENGIPITYWTIDNVSSLLALPTKGYDGILTNGLDMTAIKNALIDNYDS